MQLSAGPISKTIDIRGEHCPYTMIQTRDALKPMADGDVLEVLVDYMPAVEETIPGMCKRKQYPLEIVEEDDLWRMYIRKVGPPQ